MSANLDRSVIYTYRIQTNFAEVSSEADQELTDTQSQVDDLQQSMTDLQTQTETTTETLKVNKQEIQNTIITLTAMSAAVTGVTNGLMTLGIVSGEDAERLKQVNAAFQVMIGMATGLKSLALVQEMLNLQALKGAIINTYNSVLESPWKLALVSAGAGAAVGVAAAYGTMGGTTVQNTTNNIIVRDTSGGQANAANSLNATINGGKVL